MIDPEILQEWREQIAAIDAEADKCERESMMIGIYMDRPSCCCVYPAKGCIAECRGVTAEGDDAATAFYNLVKKMLEKEQV